MRIAHISDLHFGSFALNPLQFFSKRWLGNFNYLLKRKKEFHYDRLIELIQLFKEEGVTHVIITGDLSVTSRRVEFQMGKRFVELLRKEGVSVFTIPGNHDHYTRRSYRKRRFYKFFDSQFDGVCPLSLKEDKVTYTKVDEGLWLVAIDTAVATSMVSSQGHFTKEVEANLEKALKAIPREDRVILINHFPFFETEKGKKELVGSESLQTLIKKHPNILLYLHGHTHRQTVADLRPNELPILSDSGSTPLVERGACHLLDFGKKQLGLEVFRYLDTWERKETYSFDV